MRHIFLLSLMFGFLSPLSAEVGDMAEEGSWAEVTRLPAGTTIEVIDMKLKSITGPLKWAGDAEIVLSCNGEERRLSRESVYRVSLRKKSDRLGRILLGAAIGAGAGYGVGEIVNHASSHANDFDYRIVSFPVGAVAGGVVGALMPSGNRTVYRKEHPAQHRPE